MDPRPRWLSGDWLREQLSQRSADAALTAELEVLLGQSLDDA